MALISVPGLPAWASQTSFTPASQEFLQKHSLFAAQPDTGSALAPSSLQQPLYPTFTLPEQPSLMGDPPRVLALPPQVRVRTGRVTLALSGAHARALSRRLRHDASNPPPPLPPHPGLSLRPQAQAAALSV